MRQKAKTLVLTLITLIIIGCKKKFFIPHIVSDRYKLIEQTLIDVDSILNIEDGEFWCYKLNGPILFINKETRTFIANQNNTSKSFQAHNSVFTGILPGSINIANTAFNWEGKRWTMVKLPLPKEKTKRNHLVIHELFHNIQPDIGFRSLKEMPNNHLDSYQGRLLLRLELEALKKALTVKTKLDELHHLKNALYLRAIRQSNNTIKNEENTFELNEGLAEYTALMLSGRSKEKTIEHLISNIDKFYTNETFVRSFAYQTIPVYGFLIATKDRNWHQEITATTNITNHIKSILNINISKDVAINDIQNLTDYNYKQILSEETERENVRLAKINEYEKLFLNEVTLKLSFENMNISFNPNNLVPLENHGTVYPTIRVTDNWGILSVKNGALLAQDWSYIIVSKPLKISKTKVEGNGWVLNINPNWKVQKYNSKFRLIKLDK
ncbi:hypothetical protein [Ichthyenterobacterium magnum]|uniref:Uncharacterized protein n=1 Tax=Ichthyenterobacterium magnum TaxID=1230530 RepID=A0A420DKM5_9FLAO|nr:hypothetical protein [Ichthyenterobacterium magnum]RKE94804.1 hypothetical protein BXY80_1816 [Ichthyenterobacterium magnum]